jgi:hypothetical protein
MKPAFITINQKPSRRARNGSIHHLLLQRNSKHDHLLGFSRAYSWDIHGTTVSATYCDMLHRRMKPPICSKIRGRLPKGVLSLHDNARTHTAARTLETLRKLKWEVMEHPAHSPDLAPSNFHLFGPLKAALGRFWCDEDVKNVVHQWLRAQPKTFYWGH